VVAFLVARRTREIGIRIALGAPRLGITRLVLRQAMWPAVFGVVAGLLASVAVTRVMESILFQVDPLDPAVLAAVTALVMGVSLAATLLPARRATRVDPVVVLRSE
jgi:ABC-type antimicrobial peptide transport system permease subunit